MAYKFLDEKTQGSGANNKIKQNEQLRRIIKNYTKQLSENFEKEEFILHRQYLGGWSSRYAINKQI